MAASSPALMHLSSHLLSGSVRPVTVTVPAASRFPCSGPPRPVTLPTASRFPCSGPLRPATLPTAARCFSTNADNPFYVVECDSNHEYEVRNLRDGFHIRLYMVGVGKGNVKMWIEGDKLIAEGIKEKEFDDEDDTGWRFRMPVPPNELFDLAAIKAEIKNGILRTFVPRRDHDMFVT